MRHGAPQSDPVLKRRAPEVADRGRTGLHARRWSRPVTSRRSDADVSSRDAAVEVSTSRARAGRQSRDRHADAEPAPEGRVFVLDTSVLLSDPAAFRRFTDHEVVIPLVVISELEGKRHHPELGWFARQSLRFLDELRIKYGRLDHPVLCNDEGGTLRVELNHADQSVLPLGFRNDSNDTRILSVALGLTAEGREVTLVSKDMPLRVKAASVGLTADEYRHGQASDPTWTGMADLKLGEDQVNALYSGEELELEDVEHLPCHTGLVVHSPRGSALGRVTPDKSVRLVRGDREAFGLRGRSAEQRVALDLLLDESIGIVSLGGRAGTGKSALALCAGLEATMERNRHKKVIVFRPLYAVGGQELGYLPGTENEKMSPWAQAVFDTLGAVVHANVVEEVMARGMLEVLPLTHIRGRSLHDAFVIVDEAQSLERNVLLTVLSRIGQGSRVVLTHDVAQRDNLRVGRHDGVTAVIEALKGHPIFAHVTLTRSERSPIAEVVTDLLEEIPI
ncbi:putative PhoH-like protein PhoH2 (phosphate starvation-inducible protein PsiH) [Paractinoplanes brasiliensis]|nr:putative PhoH-like protein PhoH2 (phosphate starvation-inducible protein PsiH) [Actinoplanes brasiliensis]